MGNRLVPGMQLPDGEVTTLAGGKKRLHSFLNGNAVMLYFMRDSSCVLCLHELAKIGNALEEFRRKLRVPIWVSTVISLLSVTRKGLCTGLLAWNRLKAGGAMEGPDTLGRIQAAKAAGMVHGTDSGNPLQLPAVFAADRNGIIRLVHYAATAEDVPEPRLLLTQAAN